MVSCGALFERLHPSERYKSVTSRSRFTSHFLALCYAATPSCYALRVERNRRYKSVTEKIRFSSGFQLLCYAATLLCNAQRYKRYKSVTAETRMGSGFRPLCYAATSFCNAWPGKGGLRAFQTNVCYAFCNAPGSRFSCGFLALSVTSLRLICNTSVVIINTTTTLYRRINTKYIERGNSNNE